MITYCIDHVREFYDQKYAACTPTQPPDAHLFLGSDNAANQATNNYHFSWMIIYVEENHALQTIQKNFTDEQHGKGTCFVYQICGLLTHEQHVKGTCFVYHICGLLLYTFNTRNLLCFHSHLCFIRNLGCIRRWRKFKTGAESAAVHGYELNTAF